MAMTLKDPNQDRWLDDAKLHTKILGWVVNRWPNDEEFQRLLPYAILSALDQEGIENPQTAQHRALAIFDWFCRKYGGFADKLAATYGDSGSTHQGTIVSSNAYAATAQDVDNVADMLKAWECGVDIVK